MQDPVPPVNLVQKYSDGWHWKMKTKKKAVLNTSVTMRTIYTVTRMAGLIGLVAMRRSCRQMLALIAIFDIT